MARPTRRARARRTPSGWRISPVALTALAAAVTLAMTLVVRPIRAFTQLAENVETQAVATEKLATSLEQLDARFERVNALERDVAVLKAKAGIR